MEEKTVKAPDISCGHCVANIQRELGEQPGVVSVKADSDTKMVAIKWEAPATWENLADLMAEIGYPTQEV